MRMIWLSIGILMATTVGAYAGIQPVPEIDALSGLAAMGCGRFNRCAYLGAKTAQISGNLGESRKL